MEGTLREEPLDSAGAQELLRGFIADITELYPTWMPTSGPSTEPSDFKPPDGTFVVLYVGREPAACGKL